MIKKIINFYLIQMNVFTRIHDVFHVNLLKLMFIDFLSNQMTDDEQSSETIINNKKNMKLKTSYEKNDVEKNIKNTFNYKSNK